MSQDGTDKSFSFPSASTSQFLSALTLQSTAPQSTSTSTGPAHPFAAENDGAASNVRSQAPAGAHPLVLRFLRLTAQTPSSRLPPPTANLLLEQKETDAQSFQGLRDALPSWEGEGCLLGAGRLCTLPSHFGHVFVGETLSGFISVINRGGVDVAVRSVHVHMESGSESVVQTASNELFDGAACVLTSGAVDDSAQGGLALLPPGASVDGIIRTRLHKTGVHQLIFSVHYLDAFNDSRTLRQTLRFSIASPFQVSFKAIPIDTRSISRFLLDLQLTNMMPRALQIRGAELNAASGFQVSDLNRPLEDNEDRLAHAIGARKSKPRSDEEILQDILEFTDVSLYPGDVQSFLYLVEAVHVEEWFDRCASGAESQKPLGRSGADSDPSSVSVGDLDVRWRSCNGEVGRITAMAARVAFRDLHDFIDKDHADVVVRLVAVPERVELHTPFAARCQIRNRCARSCRLYLQVRRDLVGEIVPVGTSGRHMGWLSPNDTVDELLHLLPLSDGKHSIAGVRVVDLDTRVEYPADAAEIFVQ